MRTTSATQLLWIGLALLIGGTLPLVGSSGCGGSRCSPSTSTLGDPSSSVECPGGTICYQGQCVDTCNAGSEGVDVCTDDGECPAGRPHCNEGFCSACAAPTACIPQLDICSGLVPRPPDVIGGVDGGPGRSTQEPIDSGPLDPPNPGRYDAGDEIGPQAIPLSHTATVTLRAVRVRGQAATVEVNAVVDAIRTGVVATRRACLKNPMTPADAPCEEFANPGGTCALYRKRIWSIPPDQGDLGKMSLRDPRISVPGGGVIPNGVTQTVELTYDGATGRYRVTAPATIPSNLMIYTTTYASLLEFEGSGSDLTKRQSFPPRRDGDLPRHRMPLEVCNAGMTEAQGCYGTLELNTEDMLRSDPIIADRTLDFRFAMPPDPSFNPEDVMKTEVIIDGDRNEIRCVANTDAEGLVRVPLGILERFRVAEGMSTGNPADKVDLYFQRVYRFRMEVPINLDLVPPARTDLRLELAYVWRTWLAF